MENVLPSNFVNCLMISLILSIVIMALLQKFKKLPFIKKCWQIWVLNLIFSFLIGVPFAISFYHVNTKDSVWVSLFCFIGAPSIYASLKKQNLLQYRPESLKDDVVEVPIENKIIIPTVSKETENEAKKWENVENIKKRTKSREKCLKCVKNKENKIEKNQVLKKYEKLNCEKIEKIIFY